MKKYLALILALCMLLALAACGEPSEPSGNSEPPVESGEPVSEEPVEAELDIMMSFPQFMDQWETYCKQFEEKMLAEENIKLTINLEMPSSGDYESVLQTRLTGDDAPDLFTLHSNNIATYYEAGHLADLSGEELAGKIYPDVAAMVTYDGKLLGVPIESQAWGPLYNKAIFEECGLEVPNTLDELKNVVAVLEENGYTPFMLAFQEQWVPQLMTALTLGGKVSGEVPDWVDRMNAGEGSYAEMAEIFDVIDLIMQHGTDRAMEQGAEAGAAAFANGDARTALNTLEMAVLNAEEQDGKLVVDRPLLEQCTSKKSLLYDKKGEEHYNLISALHKSMRNSDPDAAVYWLARMLEAGEDPLYVARRLIRFASEDIGLADNRALEIAVAAYQACHFNGMPECSVNLAQAVIYLSLAPRSNAVYKAYEMAKADAEKMLDEPVPLAIRNAPTRLMKELDYGKGYVYAHDTEEKVADLECLPENLAGRRYYLPTDQGSEARAAENLARVMARKAELKRRREKE